MPKQRKRSHVNRSVRGHVSTGSVLDDLEFSSEHRAALEVKISLYEAMVDRVKREKFTRRELERILDIPQPRVSEFMTGKIGKMRIETLITYAAKLGLKAEFSLRRAA